ncbi:hypothetical protein MVES1_002882 [Malassezia vespertilionis]|uniref:uncharacterized protein n=1 Tax=Malassezia vespertilionis TaxID=2020962 RepID=UPI0024B214F6|nr:uncharacterized protein MVES1_002882 [Malassezia vespertilionis]WFD07516.1 hypothetical protein MVES1_002882 [Malassezia vespertilionis]
MALSSGGPKDMTSHGITDAAGVPSEEDIFALEHSFLSLPVEELRMQLKAQQRNTEKGFAYCKALSESLLTHITNGDWSDNVAREKTKHALRSELARLRALRDRVVEARIEHLGVVFTFAEDAEAFNDWCATRLVRMVADYMLRHNCDKSTALLAQQRKIEALVDFPVFSQIRKVKESLVPDKVSGRAPSCSLALAWCTENKTALRKFKSTLEFDLRLQEFIELTRSRTSCSLRDAVVYAQKQLMPWLHAQDEADDLDKDGPARNNVTYTRAQAVRAMGLLAFGPDMWSYHDLYNVERWKYLCDTFLQIALRVYEIPPVPLLHIALSAGLSSLKSHACCSTHYHDKIGTVATNLSIAKDEKHPECPVCDANGLGELAKEVPFNHHANSILICRINGKVMDDKNPPMCLPNGMVYSETALHDLATRSADSATGISRTVSSKMQNAFLDTEKHVPFDCKEPGEKIDVYHPAESPADGCATGEENAMTPTLREQSELLWNGGRRGNLGKLDTRQNIMPRANAAPLQDSGMEASAPWHTFLRDRAYLPQSLLGNPNPRQLEAIQSPDAMSPTSPLRQATSDPTEDTYSTWSSMKTIPASRTDIKKGSSLRSATNLSSFSADDHSQSSWLESSSDSSLNTRLPSPPSRFDSLHSISGFQYQPSGGALAYRNAAGPYSSSSAKANVDESSSLTMDFGPGSSGSHFGSGIRAQLATTLSSLIEKVPLEIPEGCVRTISIAEFGCLNSRSLLLLRLVIEEFIERVKMMQHGASSPSTQDKKDLALPPEPFPIVFNVIHEDSPQADYRSFTHLLDTHPDSYMNPIWQSSCGPCLQNFLYPSFVARPFGSRIVPPNTLDVGFSLMDLHWMHTPNAQGVALATTAQAELTTFLYARSHEFKQGGVFIMAFLARQEVDVAAKGIHASNTSDAADRTSSLGSHHEQSTPGSMHDIWSTMNEMLVPCLQRLVSCGMLKSAVARQLLTLPLYPRTALQTMRALKDVSHLWSLDWSCGLGKDDVYTTACDEQGGHVLRSEPESFRLPEPAWVAFQSGNISSSVMLPEPSIPDWKNFSYTPYQKNRLISGSSKKAAPQEAGTAPADPTQSESYRIAHEFAFAAAERALHLDAPIVRKLPYRSGFQPNGVIDNKTDAFIAQRAMHRSAVELEEQRLERRLAKLVSLYSPEFEKEADAIALSPDAAPFLRRQGVQLFSLFQGKEEARKSQLLQKRTVAEQSIVKWQSDSKIPNLHSEELAIPRKPCSSLKLVNPDTYKIDNMPPHPSSTASPAERDKYAAAEFLAIRLCKDCTGLLHRIYYHQHSQETTQFTMYYRTLLRLQREITEALPDFHEMILGLQKKDTATTLASFLTDSKTLQENAMQARKDILLRLARYDQIAKATRNLPPMVDGEQSMAQQQLQLAMFPLQSLSNLGADRHGASAEQSNAPLPAHTDQLHVLMEQERLLHGYLSAAIKERNLDDVSTLKANRDEVRAEIARLQLQEKVQ